jgi:hypothetical protein
MNIRYYLTSFGDFYRDEQKFKYSVPVWDNIQTGKILLRSTIDYKYTFDDLIHKTDYLIRIFDYSGNEEYGTSGYPLENMKLLLHFRNNLKASKNYVEADYVTKLINIMGFEVQDRIFSGEQQKGLKKVTDANCVTHQLRDYVHRFKESTTEHSPYVSNYYTFEMVGGKRFYLGGDFSAWRINDDREEALNE